MKTHLRTGLAFAIGFAPLIKSHAASVGYVGAQLNLGDGWRTPAVTKTQDIDGNNVYGSLGYSMFTTHSNSPDTGIHGQQGLDPLAVTGTLNSLPAYLTLTRISADTTYCGDYSLIDDPAGGADIWSGIGYVGFVGGNSQSELFRLNIGAGVPAGLTLRVGIFTDNTGPIDGSPIGLRIAGVGASTGDSGLIAKAQATQVNSYYFFDLTNVTAGDTFGIYGQRQAGTGPVVFGGLTFDSVPEPSAALLLGLAGLCAARRARRN